VPHDAEPAADGADRLLRPRLLRQQVAVVPVELHHPTPGEHLALLALPLDRGHGHAVDHPDGDVGGEETTLLQGLDVGSATVHVRSFEAMGDGFRWIRYGVPARFVRGLYHKAARNRSELRARPRAVRRRAHINASRFDGRRIPGRQRVQHSATGRTPAAPASFPPRRPR
jgi:hypothetical protein